VKKTESPGGMGSPFAEISDEDIDNLSASSDRNQVTKCPSSTTHPARSTARSSITARSVREDDEPPVHLQQDQPRDEGQADHPRTETDRTLFFDFLPLSLGEIRGFKTRFHLYTVPGQVFYDASRKLILKGVDGVVFVADSQVERMEANIESFENLRANLSEQGYDLNRIPTWCSTTSETFPTPLRSRSCANRSTRARSPSSRPSPRPG
jgi:hypothetical protein